MRDSLVMFKTELDTVNLFSDRMRAEFIRLGYEIYDFDMSDFLGSMGGLYSYMENHRIVAMIGFNLAIFGFETKTGANVWETLGIPCINILLDHPFWYHDILTKMPANSVVLCVDKNHMNYVSRFYPTIAVTGFLPHGGTPSDENPISIKDKKHTLLYAGSYYATAEGSKKPDFSFWDFEAEKVSDRAVERLLSDPTDTIEIALEKELISAGINLPDDMLRLFISNNVYIERIVSSHYREKLVCAAANSGLPLTIYGGGWDKLSWIKLSNVDYRGMITPDRVLSEIRNSKITLNSFPWFKDGSHERIYNAMLNGSVVASDHSLYLEESLPNGTWISTGLSDRELTDWSNSLKSISLDTEKLQSMSDRAYAHAIENETWESRARELHNDLLINI